MTKFWFTFAAVVGILFFISSCSSTSSKAKKSALSRAPNKDSPHKGIFGGKEYFYSRHREQN
ncbi:MAG: hypothetical protein HN509_06115 [Halobacteriovoraceae bacterium]|nr:hypothetical protein [Halobacteriovoraceae bacterium]MBT5094346.1 hypothetical protein [Halobacteriovoraceae bacterium]